MLGGCRKKIHWMSGIFFVSALSGFLLSGALARLSSPIVAKPLLAKVFEETLLKTGFAQKFVEARDHLRTLPADQALKVPNFPEILITAGEAAELEADELTEMVSDRVADQLYLGHIPAADDEIETFGANILTFGPLSAVFSSRAHKTILRFRSFILIFAIFWGFLLVVSGRRFGRLFSLGAGLAVGGFLPVAVYEIFINRFEVAKRLLPLPGGQQINLTPIIMSIKEVAQESRSLPGTVLIVGLVFILLSFMGKLTIGRMRK